VDGAIEDGDAPHPDVVARPAALFLKHGVGRVNFWGVTDAWLHDFPIPGRVNYPLLWDHAGREKPAFHAVVEALRKPQAR
jgi:GH35 family endo-1,4-beta-xylanase